MILDIVEICDIDGLSDNELFILLMGMEYTDCDSTLPVIQFVKSAVESQVAFEV